VLNAAELREIGSFCRQRDLILVSDEIYETIVYGSAKHISPLAAVPELRDRFLHVNSLSKTYAMPGWRVGYCAGPAKIIQRLFMVLAQSSRGPATFVQDAAAMALSGSQECVETMRAEYARRREQVLNSGVPMLPPEGGFFAMADVRGRSETSNEIRQRLLREHGLVVVHGAAYGPAGEGTLRVSFASGGDALREGLARLRQGLS
jgi:aspartate/methionine/tyrosine aminotransferase